MSPTYIISSTKFATQNKVYRQFNIKYIIHDTFGNSQDKRDSEFPRNEWGLGKLPQILKAHYKRYRIDT